MYFYRYLFIAAFLVFASVNAYAADSKDLVDKVLKVSGILGQLDDLGQAVLAAVPADALPTPKMRNDAASLLKKIAAKAVLQDIMEAAVRANTNPESLEAVARFYATKLGKRVASINETALESTNLKNIRESRKLLTSLDEARLNLIRNMIALESFPDSNRNMLNSVVNGLLEGSLGSSPESLAQTKQLVEGLKIVERFLGGNKSDENALLSFAYNYRNLDDRELQELADFLRTEPSKEFSKALEIGFDNAVFTISKALGESAAKWKDGQSQ